MAAADFRRREALAHSFVAPTHLQVGLARARPLQRRELRWSTTVHWKFCFLNFPPRAIVDGDIESNPKNYEDGSLKPYDQLVSIQLPIYNGMRVCFTKNVRRDIDFVNGMGCTVETLDSRVQAVRARTDTGRLEPVWPYTDVNMGNATYYPLRAGYAATTLKYAGTELKHVTLHLDAPEVPGAA